MRTPVLSTRFRRDVKRAEKSGKDMSKLKAVLSTLIEAKPLPAIYDDHPLKGEWKGFRDLHIELDWLLLYRVHGDELQLARTGRMRICLMNNARKSANAPCRTTPRLAHFAGAAPARADE